MGKNRDTVKNFPLFGIKGIFFRKVIFCASKTNKTTSKFKFNTIFVRTDNVGSNVNLYVLNCFNRTDDRNLKDERVNICNFRALKVSLTACKKKIVCLTK